MIYDYIFTIWSFSLEGVLKNIIADTQERRMNIILVTDAITHSVHFLIYSSEKDTYN